jgi:hypothetical protein
VADFPAAVPDLPDVVPGNTLATAHGAVSQTGGLNRTIGNVLALATKLGSVVGPPTPRKVLAGTASGQSGWVDYAAGATIVVAASNASAAAQATATYVCDGVADEVEIDAALQALPTGGGMVRLTEGTFALSGAPLLQMRKANSHLVGAGMDATILRVVDNAGTAVNGVLITVALASCSVRDLTIDGNKTTNAAQTNMFGIQVAGSGTNVLVERVRIRNGPGYGFLVSPTAGGVRLVSCIADSNTAQGFIVRSSGVTAQPVVDRCISRSNNYGYNSDNGSVLFTNCAAISNVNDGFSVGAAQTRLVGCDAYANAGNGIVVTGAFAEVIGCRLVQNTLHGLYTVTGSDMLIADNQAVSNGQHGLIAQGPRALVVGNRAFGNGTAANNTYGNMLISSDDLFVDGNIVRRGAAANRAAWGIWLNTGTNTYLGGNDTYDSGVSGPLSDTGTNTRRVAKPQLDYVLASDYVSVVGQPANTWLALCPDQTFRIDSPVNLAVVAVRGSANVGPGGAPDSEVSMRLLVDGTPYWLGGAVASSGSGYVNPFAGVGAAPILGLAVGNHTVRVEVLASQVTTVYLRAASFSNAENLAIQVMEYGR